MQGSTYAPRLLLQGSTPYAPRHFLELFHLQGSTYTPRLLWLAGPSSLPASGGAAAPTPGLALRSVQHAGVQLSKSGLNRADFLEFCARRRLGSESEKAAGVYRAERADATAGAPFWPRRPVDLGAEARGAGGTDGGEVHHGPGAEKHETKNMQFFPLFPLFRSVEGYQKQASKFFNFLAFT